MTYKALTQVGPWKAGDIIGTLPQKKIEQLLEKNAIEKVVEVVAKNTATTKGAKANGE